MKGFKINNSGDLVIENGDLVIVSEDEELRQCVFSVLNINKDEWFLDLNLGLDYKEIRGKTTEERIKAALIEAILQIERIKDVYIDEIEIDKSDRSLTVVGYCTDKDGNQINLRNLGVNNIG